MKLIRISTLVATIMTAAWLLSSPAGALDGEEPVSQIKLPEPTMIVAEGTPARAYPHMEWNRVPRVAEASWAQFQSWAGGSWQVLWDMDKGVPSRIYGSGIAAPGSIESPGVAEEHAIAVLQQHMELLAPGAQIEDFEVVTNHLHRGMRTIGMLQSHRGMRVLGGQVNFRFKADRLFVIGSEAAPFVSVPTMDSALDMERMARKATQWVDAEASEAWHTGIEGPEILPIVSRGGVRYHGVYCVMVEARSPRGLWYVYMDASTGEPVAREQQLRFGEGTVTYNVPLRYPNGDRAAVPAREATLTVDGAPGESDNDGRVLWGGTTPINVTTGVTGPRVNVFTELGATATDLLPLSDGGTLEWDRSGDELADAQISAFIHTRIIKDFTRTMDPNLAFLDTAMTVNVNIDDECNAFYDGTSINFFRSSNVCENTGLLADVVYHEFGHALHDNAALNGVGIFAFAFSEGLSDYLAAAYNDDPGMGRGFFFNDVALRHLDPPDDEARWPEDIGEVHETGEIFGGAMWDLRKSLIVAHGAEVGAQLANDLFYAAVQGASSIPNTYVEILAADDDDGDLSNGTPNECDINYTFGALHGIGPSNLEFDPLGAQAPTGDGHEIRVPVPASATRCPGEALASVRVEWAPRDLEREPGAPEILDNTVELVDMGGEFVGTIPQQADGTVIRYRVVLTQMNDGVAVFPSNRADTAYEFYVGELTELYCHDFETDPFAEDWQALVVIGQEGPAVWEWGEPGGLSSDPASAHQGTGIIGTDLGLTNGDGVYSPNLAIVAVAPTIDTSNFSDVRLQYRRWLTVEDALYDQADILSNGKTVWTNLNTGGGSTHHLDTGWVFHDVPLNETVVGQSVQVSFALTSDPGLEFGGWNIDEFCIMANPAAICGDGELAAAEQCDAGAANNDTEPNACRSNCRLAFCGDGVVDAGEQCDDRNTDEEDGCDNQCLIPGGEAGGCGCDVGSPSPDPRGVLLLLGITVLWFVRRRRMQAAIPVDSTRR